MMATPKATNNHDHSGCNEPGMIATMTVKDAADAVIFLAFVEQVHVPGSEAGRLMVMDNPNAHKAGSIRNHTH